MKNKEKKQSHELTPEEIGVKIETVIKCMKEIKKYCEAEAEKPGYAYRVQDARGLRNKSQEIIDVLTHQFMNDVSVLKQRRYS